MTRLFIGSANVLNLQGLSFGGDDEQARYNDPKLVKEDIGLADVSRALFSLTTTGVRFWPFLLVVRDIEGHSQTAKLRTLKRIRENQPSNRRNIGPSTIGTLRPYGSMYRVIAENRAKHNVAPLWKFLSDARRKYQGGLAIFGPNEQKWKSLLVKSMGAPAREFAQFLQQEQKRQHRDDLGEDGDISVVERAITRVLEAANCDALLWKGAAYYAFLRCMYGTDSQGLAESDVKRRAWSDALLRALGRTTRDEAQPLKKYVHAIQSSRVRAPWAKVFKRLRARDRVVLADLRFHVFATLYLRPNPRGV